VRPTTAPIDSPAVLAAQRAVARAFGADPLFTREGGSGARNIQTLTKYLKDADPIATFQRILNQPESWSLR
jgi:hypothetical protein